jgi:O-antigen ligase
MIAKMSYSQNWGPGIAEGHSAYIDLALGTGLVGMLTYVLILGILAKRLFALYKCSNSKTYAYWFALIVFGISNGIIESVIIVPTALSFIITLVLINMSFLPQDIRYSAMIPVRNRSSRIC